MTSLKAFPGAPRPVKAALAVSPRASRRYPLVISAISLRSSTMLGAVPDADDALERVREEERQLVLKGQAGDRAAVGELLTRHGPSLYRSVLLPRLGSEAAAKDALSETYAKVVERIGQFRWQNVGFYPWLRVVALRVALDHLRAQEAPRPLGGGGRRARSQRSEHAHARLISTSATDATPRPLAQRSAPPWTASTLVTPAPSGSVFSRSARGKKSRRRWG